MNEKNISNNLTAHEVTLRALSHEILIFSHLKLCFATAIHNFKRLKMCVICQVPTYISVSRLKAYFTFNKLIIQVPVKSRMSAVVDIRVLRVNSYSAGIDFSRQNLTSGNNLSGVAVQFATQFEANATQ